VPGPSIRGGCPGKRIRAQRQERLGQLFGDGRTEFPSRGPSRSRMRSSARRAEAGRERGGEGKPGLCLERQKIGAAWRRSLFGREGRDEGRRKRRPAAAIPDSAETASPQEITVGEHGDANSARRPASSRCARRRPGFSLRLEPVQKVTSLDRIGGPTPIESRSLSRWRSGKMWGLVVSLAKVWATVASTLIITPVIRFTIGSGYEAGRSHMASLSHPRER